MESNNIPLTARTLRACVEVGVEPKELESRAFHDFFIPGDFIERQKLRFNHFESRRQAKIKTVLDQRGKIVSLMSEPSRQSAEDCLNLLDGLLGKEARRLEKDLRHRVRVFESVDRDNLAQIGREETIKERDEARESRIQRKAQTQKMRAGELHAKIEASILRQKHSKRLLEDTRIEKISRLRERMEALDAAVPPEIVPKSGHGSSVWDDRLEVVKKNHAMKEASISSKLEDIKSRFENRLLSFEMRKKEEEKQKMLQHERDTIKLLDALEKRKQLDSLSDARASQVDKQINMRQDRLSALLAARDAIVKHRKSISQNQSRCTPLKLSTMTPGPVDYVVIRSTLKNKAPKFSTVTSNIPLPGTVEFEMKKAQEVPPPGAYNPKVLPSGQPVWTDKTVTINPSEKHRVGRADDMPGPGTYELADRNLSNKGFRYGRRYVHV